MIRIHQILPKLNVSCLNKVFQEQQQTSRRVPMMTDSGEAWQSKK